MRILDDIEIERLVRDAVAEKRASCHRATTPSHAATDLARASGEPIWMPIKW